MSSESQDKISKNKQAMTSLVMGIASVVLALFNFAPGLCSALGCVGAVAAVFALISGIQGICAARQLEGQRRNLAIVGMVAGGIGLLVCIILMVSTYLETMALLNSS
jgi:hypothetical protein